LRIFFVEKVNSHSKQKNPAAFLKCSGVFILFGKKRGRKEEKGQRLTASAVFHEIRISSNYVRRINGV